MDRTIASDTGTFSVLTNTSHRYHDHLRPEHINTEMHKQTDTNFSQKYEETRPILRREKSESQKHKNQKYQTQQNHLKSSHVLFMECIIPQQKKFNHSQPKSCSYSYTTKNQEGRNSN